MKTKVLYKGSIKSIESLSADDGSWPVDEFLDGLSASDRTKVDALFALMGEKGRIANVEKFKKLEKSEGIFEFKSFQTRLLCFHAPGGRLIVCRGVQKKKDKHDKQDIEFAEACKKKFTGE
ncbi:type II toxin-antitoxin system RelE/ParE family toxin [Stenotrophomonas maltophilia]|uniref:type II toxin-antitoxin system RelE/ParE family toxin n=1 Tax=Stenotrophomonas maltophilia TaxID=40324 RepID=UPI00159532B9|nr:type II toxin-antitoxin system RelE/ParE family toxin [Stenotrophomonas maltophilia]